MISFNIDNWSVWDLDENLQTQHTNIQRGPAQPTNLSAMVKRRMPPLARAIYKTQAMMSDSYLPTVYASKHAELSRTIGLIRQFGGDLSPMQFSLSVNNAIPGLLSVITNNQHPYTVIDSLSGVVEMALFEAVAWLGTYNQVRIVYFEEKTQSFISDSFPVNDIAVVLAMDISVGTDYTLASKKQTAVASDVTDCESYARFLAGEVMQLTSLSQRLQWHWHKQ